ncbi:putative cytochrome P460 [Rhodopseudomonas palustris TIE-1]|uniref:cytochrome P460 family protein n=1 Tax=Rhodopseudomonas palustris TaxID=1076 RepID=UPI000164B47F|nr:cytochrome P460 family protein [Rhodopseudomonas palustris]ACF02340.1 putative cytochrome P460 [Rhodopseudomonas palustris TIE-1]
MKPLFAGAVGTAAAVCAVASLSSASQTAANKDTAGARAASPIYGVTLPEGYRTWPLVAPAEEGEPLDELRAVLGNPIAQEAYAKGQLPFPDGTVLVKLAWKRTPSGEFESASVPGAATTVQVMVKDSRKFAGTGGWGFGRFVQGRPTDEAEHQTCFACHQARVAGHDYVFTRYAR